MMSIGAARLGLPTPGTPEAPDGEKPEAKDGRGVEPSGSMTRVTAGWSDDAPARLDDEPNGDEPATAGDRADDPAAAVGNASPRAAMPAGALLGSAIRITLGAPEATLDADGAALTPAAPLGAAPKKPPPEPPKRPVESGVAPETEAVCHAGDAGMVTVGAGGILVST